MIRRMGPLAADHPLVAGILGTGIDKCPACQQSFLAGDYVTLIPLGPGVDDEAQKRARVGRAYNAIALPVHWPCATGDTDNFTDTYEE